jgi:hypothetical protein
MRITPSIESSGFGLSGEIGGVPRRTYYTPDGRIIQAIPNMRGSDEAHLRDANLDKGWLLTKPVRKQKFCPGCTRWHKTDKEIADCTAKQKAYMKHMDEVAAKELHKSIIQKDTTIENLSKEVSELKEMMKQILEAKKSASSLTKN